MTMIPDSRIFEDEALTHLDELYRTACRLTRNAADAEDLVQEAFLQAWKSFPRYESGTNCRAWLYKILMFKLAHYRRSAAMQARFALPIDDVVIETVPMRESVPDHLTDAEVVGALASLSAEHRTAIVLADVYEYGYKETAEILEVPIGTVMSRLSRGRANLRPKLVGAARRIGINKAAAIPAAA